MGKHLVCHINSTLYDENDLIDAFESFISWAYAQGEVITLASPDEPFEIIMDYTKQRLRPFPVVTTYHLIESERKNVVRLLHHEKLYEPSQAVVALANEGQPHFTFWAQLFSRLIDIIAPPDGISSNQFRFRQSGSRYELGTLTQKFLSTNTIHVRYKDKPSTPPKVTSKMSRQAALLGKQKDQQSRLTNAGHRASYHMRKFKERILAGSKLNQALMKEGLTDDLIGLPSWELDAIQEQVTQLKELLDSGNIVIKP